MAQALLLVVMLLRCSSIVCWVETLIHQKRSDSTVTNEELTPATAGDLERVATFVRAARTKGDAAMARWVGEQSIAEFLRLQLVFQKSKVKKNLVAKDFGYGPSETRSFEVS